MDRCGSAMAQDTARSRQSPSNFASGVKLHGTLRETCTKIVKLIYTHV